VHQHIKSTVHLEILLLNTRCILKLYLFDKLCGDMASQELLQGNPESQTPSGVSPVVDPEKHDIPLASRENEDAEATCQEPKSK
jgi:hypothetical protein